MLSSSPNSNKHSHEGFCSVFLFWFSVCFLTVDFGIGAYKTGI